MNFKKECKFSCDVFYFNPEPLMLRHIEMSDFNSDEDSGLYCVNTTGGVEYFNEEEMLELIERINKVIDEKNNTMRELAEKINKRS